MAAVELVEICLDEKNKAVVNLHGATLQSWFHDGVDMIFVSKNAVFDNKKAIRGGIPIIFPCFGAWDFGPQHGFARISKWVCSTAPAKTESGDAARAVFTLCDNEDTRKMWKNNRFQLDYVVTVTAKCLVTEFIVKNLNESEAFDFTCLLHTYFRLPDISRTTISGLKGLQYVDKTDGGAVKVENEDKKEISKFTDSVYKGASKVHMITEVAGRKMIALIKNNNFPDTVVWNPWAEKAKAMGDFGDDEYPNMVCVEAGYVSQPYSLPAGQTFRAAQKIENVDYDQYYVYYPSDDEINYDF